MRSCPLYARPEAWGHRHKTVHHGRGEYARDEDGDGFREVHVNTIEGFCPCCARGCACTGASPKTSCPHLGFFQVVHDARRRGKALLGALVAALVA